MLKIIRQMCRDYQVFSFRVFHNDTANPSSNKNTPLNAGCFLRAGITSCADGMSRRHRREDGLLLAVRG